MNAITKERLKTRLAVINDHYKETMFHGDWPVMGVKIHNAEMDAIFALIESSVKVTTVGSRLFSHYPQDRAKQTEGSESGGERAAHLMTDIPPELGKDGFWEMIDAKPAPPFEPSATHPIAPSPPVKKKPYVDEGQFYDTPEQEEAREKEKQAPTDEERREMAEWFRKNTIWHERIPAWNNKDDEMRDKIRSLILTTPATPVRVTVSREWVEKFVEDVVYCEQGEFMNGVECAIKQLRTKGVIIDEGEGNKAVKLSGGLTTAPEAEIPAPPPVVPFAISSEEGKKIMVSVNKFYEKKQAPPVAPARVTVSREWVKATVREILTFVDGYGVLKRRLRSIGVVVEDGEGK